jgi:hypothetical protein
VCVFTWEVPSSRKVPPIRRLAKQTRIPAGGSVDWPTVGRLLLMLLDSDDDDKSDDDDIGDGYSTRPS